MVGNNGEGAVNWIPFIKGLAVALVIVGVVIAVITNKPKPKD